MTATTSEWRALIAHGPSVVMMAREDALALLDREDATPAWPDDGDVDPISVFSPFLLGYLYGTFVTLAFLGVVLWGAVAWRGI